MMIKQMSDSYSISNLFTLLFKTQFIAVKIQLRMSEGITLLNCQCNAFWSSIAIITAGFLKKGYRNNCCIRLHHADLEHSLMKNVNAYMFIWSSSHFYVLVF